MIDKTEKVEESRVIDSGIEYIYKSRNIAMNNGMGNTLDCGVYIAQRTSEDYVGNPEELLL